jgi:hypothetical protein
MPIVADNIDTLILNVKLRQDTGEDLVAAYMFVAERLFSLRPSPFPYGRRHVSTPLLSG